MSILEQAVEECIKDFQMKILEYKRENNLTWQQIAEACEMPNSTARYVVVGDRLNLETAYKISMGLGIGL